MVKKSILPKLLIILAIFLLLFLSAYILLRISGSRTFQFFGGIMRKIDTQEKVVALTFDDGPTERTGEILSILDECGVKATFFLTGQDIEAHPQEARMIAEAGHEIGNHTYSHPRMVFKSYSFIKREIERTDALIRESGYAGEIHFRPPYGKKLLLLPLYLKQHGQKTILWDLEPNSYPEIDASSENIVRYVVDNVQPGSIVLLHAMYDNKGTTIGALKGIIEGLREKGYTFYSV